MQETFDVLVIGSGPAGANAACALAEAGLKVGILDGGFDAPAILKQEPMRDFETVRRTDPGQWKLFLGEDRSGIPVSGLEGGLGGGMSSGNRSFVAKGVTEHLPLSAENGLVMQSLAKGGLGAIWGGTSAFMSAEDMTAMGLPAEDMDLHYDRVTQRVGISGPATRPHIQPPLPLDHHALAIAQRAYRYSRKLRTLKVTVAQPHAAVLTQDLGNRKASEYTDMEYYSDATKSVYRPAFTIEDLRQRENVHYIPGVIVQEVRETAEGVTVCGYALTDSRAPLQWRAKKVILAAGAVNTARILLRSLKAYNKPVPFVAKPHMYVACLRLSSMGKAGPAKRNALCQLIMTDDERDENNLQKACAQLYSYRSLLLFRLLESVPFLPVPEALGLLSLYAPSLILADIRFPASEAAGHTLTLTQSDSGTDHVRITCIPGRTASQKKSVRRLKAAMRLAGLLPVHTADMPEASTSHHAGTVPFDPAGTRLLGSDRNGKVNGFTHVYAADASVFRCLPALPHTLTIMANADRIGTIVARELTA